MAATSVGTGLWALPPGPAPKSNVPGSTFVTIWAFICTGFVALFFFKLRGPNPTWPEFKNIRNPTVLLSVWYIASAADRWMHYDQEALPYGYVLFDSLNRVLQIASTIWYLWGTYGVIWNELKRRFTREVAQGCWWLAAKITIFLISVVSFFYVVLNIALRVVWIQFLSLNVIADVASKRNHFEIAMTAFFSVFGLLTFIAAVTTLVYRANKTTGTWAKTRIYLIVATVMLFARSMAECVLVSLAQTPGIRQSDVQLPYDILYGLLTSLYLTFMYLQALQVSRKNDSGSAEVENIQSDIRTHILEKLRAVTDQKRLEAPPFKIILDQTKDEVTTILEAGPLSVNSAMTPDQKRRIAENYIRSLRRQFGHLGPRVGKEKLADPLLSSNVRPVRPHGRRSAPPQSMPSSEAYESLRNASNPAIRNANSVPDMRNESGHSRSQPFHRFAPRRSEQPAFGGWRPSMAGVAEHTDLPNTQGSARRFVPTSTNEPSFTARAAAMGSGEEHRSVPDPATGPPRRRMFSPRDPADDLGAPGTGQFAAPAQPPAEFPPEPYPSTHPAPQTMPQYDSGPQAGRRTFAVPQYDTPGERSHQEQRYQPFVQAQAQSYAGAPSQAARRYSTQQSEYAQTTASSQSPVNWTHELPDIHGSTN